MLVGLLLLLTWRLLKDRFDAPAARVAALLLACLSVQVFASSPLMEHGSPSWWQAPLVGISVGNSVLFWLFARSIFDDEFFVRRRHMAVWLATLCLGALFFAVVVMPQERRLGPLQLVVAIAMRWVPICFAAMAVMAVSAQWRVDLMEGRRRLRVFILAMGTVYTLTMAFARLASDDGRLTAWMAGVDTLLLLAIVGPSAGRLLRLSDTELLPRAVAAAAPVPGAPRPNPASKPDPAEERLAVQLEHLMTHERAYSADDLTIGGLADRLKAPEYRLRRLINQRLGHRNFNAYVNGFRLEAARTALADPARRELSVLAIALDAGFQSIGPFNRAFKAATGTTPTEFRRQKLADT